MFGVIVVSLLFLLFSRIHCLEFVADGDKDLSVQIQIDTGVVQGVGNKTAQGTKYTAYRGIPYAAPPTDDLRFRPPQPALNWEGVLNATLDGSKCVQFISLTQYGSEDCLFINVYVPKNESNEPLKVMVWIHGGGFISGTSEYSYFGPDYLLDLGVIVVTFNYRLGIFGFLSTEDMASPGNYGLKDQIAALRWVNANIARFGGDPGEVTIFGESAGGASVSYMLLAPQAKGLFQRAISQSGSALCPWALQSNPQRLAVAVGAALGIVPSSSEQLVKNLRKVNTYALFSVSTSAAIMGLVMPLNGLAYSPSIEPEHPDAILAKGAHELLRTGQYNKVPYIIGINSEESAVLQYIIDLLRPFLVQFDLAPNMLIPSDMNARRLSLGYVQLTLAIRRRYFGALPITVDQRKSIISYVSDTQFVKPEVETARLMANFSSVYFYQFSYEGSAGFKGSALNEGRKGRIEKGVGHSEEMWYLWKRDELEYKSADLYMIGVFRTLWVNFAKYGNPTPENSTRLDNLIWPKMDSERKYLNIGSDIVVEREPKKEVVDFWNNLYDTYGNPPYTTY